MNTICSHLKKLIVLVVVLVMVGVSVWCWAARTHYPNSESNRLSITWGRTLYHLSRPDAGKSTAAAHNYGIVIDAGSSGSKVYIFHWPPHDGDPEKLLDIQYLLDPHGVPYTKKVQPGATKAAVCRVLDLKCCLVSVLV